MRLMNGYKIPCGSMLWIMDAIRKKKKLNTVIRVLLRVAVFVFGVWPQVSLNPTRFTQIFIIRCPYRDGSTIYENFTIRLRTSSTITSLIHN